MGFRLQHTACVMEVCHASKLIVGTVVLTVVQDLGHCKDDPVPLGSSQRALKSQSGSLDQLDSGLTPDDSKDTAPFTAASLGDQIESKERQAAYELPINCSSQVQVNAIKVNGSPISDSVYRDPLSPILPVGTKSVENHPLLRRTLGNALLDSDNGELRLPLPKDLQLEVCTWTVQIDYTLKNPGAGFYFSSNADDNGAPYAYSAPPMSMARLWMPCIDDSQARCTWELEIIVDVNELPVVVGPGLVEQIEHPFEPESKRIWRFLLGNECKTCASSIVVAAGRLTPVPLPLSVSSAAVGHGGVPAPLRQVCAFSEGAVASKTRLTCDCVSSILDYLEKLTRRPFPFPNLSLVFLPCVANAVVSGAAVLVFPSSLLVGKGVIDAVFSVRQTLASAIASQYFSHFLGTRHWADIWISVGMERYLSCLYVRESMGHNEFRYRLKKDIERVCALDTQQLPLVPPISDQNDVGQLYWLHYHPYDEPTSQRSEFFLLKAGLVVYMLDKRLGKSMFSNFLTHLFSEVYLAEFGYLQSTDQILGLARKVAVSFDAQQFSEQWLQRPGCPVFKISYVFNRKSMQFEFFFRQSSTNTEAALSSSTFRYRGPLTFRIKEPNGVFDTEVHLEEKEQKLKVLYHSKYRKKRRQLDGNAQQTQQSEGDAADFDWILMDPECEWVCVKQFQQTDYMLVSQLKHLDVGGQLDAAIAMGKLTSQRILEALEKALLNSHYMYRVRIEALWSMVKGANAEPEYKLWVIDKLCLSLNSVFESGCSIPKPNDFSKNLANYFLMENLPLALASIQLEDEKVGDRVAGLLLNMLRYNDNNQNVYDDSNYLACLIKACALLRINQACSEGFKEGIIAEVERYRLRDRFLPSYGNVVTLACMQAHFDWMLNGLEPVDYSLFLAGSLPGNFTALRSFALDSLLLLQGLGKPRIFDYVLNLIRYDDDPLVRYEMCRGLAVYTFALSQSTSESDERLLTLIKRIASTPAVREQIWGLANDFRIPDLRVCREAINCLESLYVGEQLPNSLRLKTPTSERSTESLMDPKAVQESAARLAEQERRHFVKQTQFILHQLKAHPYITDFLYPVDDAIAPNYRSIIPYPMDLQTAEKKLKGNKYGSSLENFIKDIRQIFINCKVYNLEGSPIYDMADKLANFFEKEVLIEAMTLPIS